MSENVDSFISHLRSSLAANTFVKLTLGNYKGSDPSLQKLLIRRLSTKKGERLFFLYRHATRDTTKNYDFETGVALIDEAIETGFNSGHLFTTTNDLQLEVGRKGKSRLNVGKPTFKAAPTPRHDRKKAAQLDPSAFYLRALGITDDNGRVRDREQDKWRQINKFVEVLAGLVDKSALKEKQRISVLDMGSGKGYLTFAAYDYFRNTKGVDITMTGVDTKADLVELDNGIAAASGFDGLTFRVGSILDSDAAGADILIALHACNTATDDALFQGITAAAELIIAAPCCHQEIRPQIKPPSMLRDVLKHGTLLERTAETVTDGLRSLLLEREGYDTKVFEFVGVEHTPKNNMLVGTRTGAEPDRSRFDAQIAAIKAEFGISEHRLEKLLSGSSVNNSITAP